jgi:flagellar basal-body rod protein FlgF
MNVSLYQAAAALNANSRWQEIISENLAASSVPGYKKQELSFAGVQAGLLGPNPGAAGTELVMPRVTTATNFQPGTLRSTGEKTDLALEGPGFFEVRLPDGARAYTRDGEFHLDAQGQLVTKQGYAVLGDDGPIQFDLNNPAPFSVAPTGEVSQGADAKGRIKVVSLADPQKLTSLGSGCFQPHDPAQRPQEAVGTTLRQGFLEGANTSPVLEMANLVTAMRLFETNQRVLQMHDERMGRAISELGSPS